MALAGAVMQTIAIAVAAAMTGSAALFAQTAANVADVVVQLFLMIGVASSARLADDSHPLGYGRERYFWFLFAALGIFGGGAFIAFDQAVHTGAHSTPGGSLAIGYVVLAITIVLDGVAFAVGLVSLRRQAAARRRSLRQEIVRTTDPADATVVLGSGVQLVGGLLAFMALIVWQATGNTTADAVASALIGVLLMVAAVVLLQANRQLLTARGLAPPIIAEMRAVVAAQAGVLDVPDLFAVVVGPASLVVDGDVTFDDRLDVPAVEATITQAATALRERWPAIAYVYLTPVAGARPRSFNPPRPRYGRTTRSRGEPGASKRHRHSMKHERTKS